MYAPDGTPALVLRVGGAGTPRVSVGDAAHGDEVVVHRQGVEVWRGGDVVAEVWSGEVWSGEVYAARCSEPGGTWPHAPAGGNSRRTCAPNLASQLALCAGKR